MRYFLKKRNSNIPTWILAAHSENEPFRYPTMPTFNLSLSTDMRQFYIFSEFQLFTCVSLSMRVCMECMRPIDYPQFYIRNKKKHNQMLNSNATFDFFLPFGQCYVIIANFSFVLFLLRSFVEPILNCWKYFIFIDFDFVDSFRFFLQCTWHRLKIPVLTTLRICQSTVSQRL